MKMTREQAKEALRLLRLRSTDIFSSHPHVGGERGMHVDKEGRKWRDTHYGWAWDTEESFHHHVQVRPDYGYSHDHEVSFSAQIVGSDTGWRLFAKLKSTWIETYAGGHGASITVERATYLGKEVTPSDLAHITDDIFPNLVKDILHTQEATTRWGDFQKLFGNLDKS